mgnify:CR=1 FL=1
MSWFNDILDDPVALTGAGTPLLNYEQINLFAQVLLVFLVMHRDMPREVALIIVGIWAARQAGFFHRRRRIEREFRGGRRYEGPGW